MKTPKVAVFSHACALQVNRKIYRIMADDGCDVRIFVPANTIHPIEPADEKIPVTTLRRRGKRTRFHYYPGLSCVLDEARPDFILLDLEPDSLLACQLAAWASANKARFLIQTCENLPIWKTSAGKSFPNRLTLSLLRRAFLRYTAPRISHAFTISEGGKALLESFGLNHRVSIIPLGVDTAIFRPDSDSRDEVRQSWGVDPETPIVSYFGRLLPEKGVDLLIAALLELTHLPWKFAIDRFREESDSYAREISKLLENEAFENRLIWIHAKHEEVPRYMGAVDIIAAPSIRLGGFMEQYGRVIPEGLACGAEVITSDTGAFPEVGGGFTRIFGERSHSGLVASLSAALSIPNRERITRASEKHEHISQERSLRRQWELMKPHVR